MALSQRDVKGNPVIKNQHIHNDDHPVIHTVLVDRDDNILGCIDQLEKNAQLIRLDGGLHWGTSNPVDRFPTAR